MTVAPGDTDWGMHEGSHTDPDRNVIRFGSPMRRAAELHDQPRDHDHPDDHDHQHG